MKDELEELIDAAETAYLDGAFDEAIELAKKVCKRAPEDTSGLHILGCASYAAGDEKTAVTKLKKLASICRKQLARAGSAEDRQYFQEILHTIGDDLVTQAEGRKGVQAARFLLDQVGLDTPAALEAAADDDLRKRKHEAARGLLVRLVAHKPNDGAVAYRLASTLAKLGREAETLHALERAISLDRAYVSALKDSTFKRFHKSPALIALCQPRTADPRVDALYAKLGEAQFEAVLADAEALLGQPTDTLAVLEAMNDALENLGAEGVKGLDALAGRVEAQLKLLKRAGAKSAVYETFLYNSLKDS